MLPGFTASKILWLKRNEPKNFARLAHRPAAARLFEFLVDRKQGDGIWRRQRHGVARCQKSANGRKAVLQAIDPGLDAALPPLIASDQPAGFLQDATARELGLERQRFWSAPAAATT